MQLLATSEENVLGHRAEVVLKQYQEFPKKIPALCRRVSQVVKVTWGLKGANEDEGHPPGNTKKEQGAGSRTTKGWKAFFLHLNRSPRVTTLLVLKNPWRQAANPTKTWATQTGREKGGEATKSSSLILPLANDLTVPAALPKGPVSTQHQCAAWH